MKRKNRVAATENGKFMCERFHSGWRKNVSWNAVCWERRSERERKEKRRAKTTKLRCSRVGKLRWVYRRGKVDELFLCVLITITIRCPVWLINLFNPTDSSNAASTFQSSNYSNESRDTTVKWGRTGCNSLKFEFLELNSEIINYGHFNVLCESCVDSWIALHSWAEDVKNALVQDSDSERERKKVLSQHQSFVKGWNIPHIIVQCCNVFTMLHCCTP